MDNCLVISGVVDHDPETRYTPTGIPITRFTLRHESVQREAGLQRQAILAIGVVASGSVLHSSAVQLRIGQGIRVKGFLSRSNNRQGESRLVLHAEQIETLWDRGK